MVPALINGLHKSVFSPNISKENLKLCSHNRSITFPSLSFTVVIDLLRFSDYIINVTRRTQYEIP